jgi:hypothetical protein
MALSPQYSWPEPDNSSLVKNGAQDIRALGDAIDTSVWNVGYGQAGKNKIINGDFRVNQRSFTSTTTTATYGFDRWSCSIAGDGTATYSAQTFTAGAAPVAGYEGTNFARFVTTGQTTTTTRTNWLQSIEDVRTFAGNTITVSFWAKAATGTPKMSIEMTQYFGPSGSATVIIDGGRITLSTSWARYSVTLAIPSVSGKTINAGSNLGLLLWVSGGSDFNSRIGSMGIQSNTFDIWGVQVEYGAKASPFQLAGGGDPQSELAMCQRYYVTLVSGIFQPIASAFSNSATLMRSVITFPVTMRTGPTLIASSGTSYYMYRNAASDDLFNSLTIGDTGTNACSVFNNTEIASVLGYGGYILTNNASGSVAFSAEL